MVLRAALLSLLLSILSGPVCADQTRIPNYSSARPLLWDEVYPLGGETLYCGQSFKTLPSFSLEHVFAASWMTAAIGCGSRAECRKTSKRFNYMEADLHNLFPSLAPLNTARSNYRFGIIKGEAREYGDCDFERDKVARLVEPRPSARGDIARAVFYIAFEYDIEVPFDMRDMLMSWHWADPVSAVERRRNDIIEELQDTRNPYIDGTVKVFPDMFRKKKRVRPGLPGVFL